MHTHPNNSCIVGVRAADRQHIQGCRRALWRAGSTAWTALCRAWVRDCRFGIGVFDSRLRAHNCRLYQSACNKHRFITVKERHTHLVVIYILPRDPGKYSGSNEVVKLFADALCVEELAMIDGIFVTK